MTCPGCGKDHVSRRQKFCPRCRRAHKAASRAAYLERELARNQHTRTQAENGPVRDGEDVSPDPFRYAGGGAVTPLETASVRSSTTH